MAKGRTRDHGAAAVVANHKQATGNRQPAARQHSCAREMRRNCRAHLVTTTTLLKEHHHRCNKRQVIQSRNSACCAAIRLRCPVVCYLLAHPTPNFCNYVPCACTPFFFGCRCRTLFASRPPAFARATEYSTPTLQLSITDCTTLTILYTWYILHTRYK